MWLMVLLFSLSMLPVSNLRRWWVRGIEMKTWRYRSCPRCRGDIFLEIDEYGWSGKCLQCGFVRELETLEEFKQKEIKKKIVADK